METIWGQVDLQNNVLLPRLKKMIRTLIKSMDEDEIRLLDMGDMSEGEDDGDDGTEDINESEEGSAASNLEENDDLEDDEEIDEDARRIRERMEKVRLSLSNIRVLASSSLSNK